MPSGSDAQHHCQLVRSGLRAVDKESHLKSSSRSLPSLLDHDTVAELLFLTGTNQPLDIRLRFCAGAQAPTAWVGQERERPLGWEVRLDL